MIIKLPEKNDIKDANDAKRASQYAVVAFSAAALLLMTMFAIVARVFYD